MAIPENTVSKLGLGSVPSGKPRVFSILAGQTESQNILNLYGMTLVGFTFPSNFTAATLTLLASIDNINFNPLTDGYTGNAITVTADASKFVRLLPSDTVGVQYLKLQSSVPQANTVEIQCVEGQVL